MRAYVAAASLFLCAVLAAPADLWSQSKPPVEPNRPAAPKAKAAKVPATIIVAPGPDGVMIACDDPEVLKEFEQMLNSLASSANPPEGSETGGRQFAIFYLKNAQAAAVAQTIERIVADSIAISSAGGAGGGLSGGAARGLRIIPDARLNALFVQADPTSVGMIQQLVKTLDQKKTPEEVVVVPKARMIPVRNVPAQEVAVILRQVFQDRMVAALGQTVAGQAGQPPMPQELLQMYGGGMYPAAGMYPGGGMYGMNVPGGVGVGRQRGAGEEVHKMTIGVDVRTNSIVVAAPEPLFSEVRQLVAQLDKAAVEKSDQTMRVIRLPRSNSREVGQALAAIVGEGVQFGRVGAGTVATMPMPSRRPIQQPGGQFYGGLRGGGYQPGRNYQPSGGYQAEAYQSGAYQPGGYPPSGNNVPLIGPLPGAVPQLNGGPYYQPPGGPGPFYPDIPFGDQPLTAPPISGQ